MERKDKITIVLGGAALGLSVVTAYFTLLRQVDDLRAVVQGNLHMSHDMRRNIAGVDAKANHRVTVSNVGNRTATIMEVTLLFRIPVKRRQTPFIHTCDGNRTVVEFAVQPIVVKPGETIVTDMVFKTGQTPASEHRRGWVRFDTDHIDDTYDIDVCIGFTVATPDTVSMYTRPLVSALLYRQNSLLEEGADYNIEPRPFTIVRRVGPLF